MTEFDRIDPITGAVASSARAMQASHVNGPTVHDEAQMPFGGVGASAYRRFGGKAGIDSFTKLRWITVETQSCRFTI